MCTTEIALPDQSRTTSTSPWTDYLQRLLGNSDGCAAATVAVVDNDEEEDTTLTCCCTGG